MELNHQILSEIVVWSKYAKYDQTKQRRETWKEIIDRNVDMHVRKFPELEQLIKNAYSFVYKKEILPSMRSLQFAGKPIEVNNARLFNCSYLHIDDYRAFNETMFLLLSGTGVGYSVSNNHIAKLPAITKTCVINFNRLTSKLKRSHRREDFFIINKCIGVSNFFF